MMSVFVYFVPGIKEGPLFQDMVERILDCYLTISLFKLSLGELKGMLSVTH